MGPVATDYRAGPGIPLPVFAQTVGNPLYGSEYLIAYEAGYRQQVTDRFAWDLALFYNEYDSFRTSSPGPLVPGPGYAPHRNPAVHKLGARIRVWGGNCGAMVRHGPLAIVGRLQLAGDESVDQPERPGRSELDARAGPQQPSFTYGPRGT